MRFILTCLFLIFGLIIQLFLFLFRRSAPTKHVPSLLPIHFDNLVSFLWGEGIEGSGTLQNIPVKHARSMMLLHVGDEVFESQTVTITYSGTQEEAKIIEMRAYRVAQYSGVCRNGLFVMACTFSPPNPELEARMIGAFSAYPHGNHR